MKTKSNCASDGSVTLANGFFGVELYQLGTCAGISSNHIWSVGPRRPSDESGCYCGWVPIYVSGWVSGYLTIWLSGYLGIFLCLVVGFRPRFHSVWSCPLCNCLVKKINQGTDVLTHNCLPPLLALCVLKHVCTRLIILTSNHKIKIDVDVLRMTEMF